MKKIDATTVTSSEWEIMRIIWTKKRIKSSDIINLINQKYDWSGSTVKTLLGRLVKKDILSTIKEGRYYIYHSCISEEDALNQVIFESFQHVCSMERGSIINNLLQKLNFSENDLKKMQLQINEKLKNAPTSIECDCLSVKDQNCC